MCFFAQSSRVIAVSQSYRRYGSGWLAGGASWRCEKSTPSYRSCYLTLRTQSYAESLPLHSRVLLLGKQRLIVANCTVCKCVASGNTSNGNVRPYLLRSIVVRWSVSRATHSAFPTSWFQRWRDDTQIPELATLEATVIRLLHRTSKSTLRRPA